MPLAAVPRIESSPRALHALIRLIDRARLVRLADSLALLCAVALPWLRIDRTIPDMRQYVRIHDWQTSTGLRLEMWHSSLAFVKDAPILGRGTGSIEKLFGQAQAAGESALVTRNPHQRIIAVAIQLGLVGVGIMFAMWIAHFLVFRRRGLAAWCGTIVVVQTVVSSVFNSCMFDFGSGWSYVWAVGVLGRTVLKKTIDHGTACGAPVPSPRPQVP